MLFSFDVKQKKLNLLNQVAAGSLDIVEKNIEEALALDPKSLFISSNREDSPVLIVRTSIQGKKMADIIAIDSQARLILIECKRSKADRQTLSQLIDYASDYRKDPYIKLKEDWTSGEGKKSDHTLLEELKNFCDDDSLSPEKIGIEQVLVVVAAGVPDRFKQQSDYLRDHGIDIHFAPIQLFQGTNESVFLEVDRISLEFENEPDQDAQEQGNQQRVWHINTDETHSKGAWKRFIEKNVIGIWGYPDGAKVLQKGAKPGEKIYAYLNGKGVIAQGVIKSGEIFNPESSSSIFPECKDGNEWHMEVEWTPKKPSSTAISNSFVRKNTDVGLPIRNTFCRINNKKVIVFLDKQF